MASTALKTEQQQQEYFDQPEDLELKINQLADAVQQSKHFIVFTGAGISTSTGIPDFRSGINTVLPTGPGAWQKLATNKDRKDKVIKPMLQAIPSKTHMAIVELSRRGILKFCISQNVDGLHRRSGLEPDKIAELHGNTNLEKCNQCQRQYFRDYKCSGDRKEGHRTGRQCGCGGDLCDSIIHFGEQLPEIDMNLGFAHARQSDLCLCLGSSMRVSPANQMPSDTVEHGGKLFIVNIQKTPLEQIATNIFAMCDVVMEKLMQQLGIPIPPFELNRNFTVSLEMKKFVVFGGVDVDGTPYSLFKTITITDSTQRAIQLVQEPFIIEMGSYQEGNLNLHLEFHGHYDEPDLNLEIDSGFINEYEPILFQLAYNPANGKWRQLN